VRIETSAPTRIDLAGGTIDIWPLYLFHPGAQTINAAISVARRARSSRGPTRASSCARRTPASRSKADDPRRCGTSRACGLLSLLASFFSVRGVTLTTSSSRRPAPAWRARRRSTSPCCAALAEWKREHYEPEALLQVAMNVEAQTIKVPTGLQDYRPALYGGLAALELEVDGIHRVRSTSICES
jgi:D-glycero-alpha-D-manno-heptose-7-phosphate kinase